jgi:hypothetical protein
MMNYDENFARAHAKSEIWLEGAFKIDVTVFEGVASGDSLSEAIRKNLENEFSTVESTQEKVVGSRSAALAILATKNSPSDKHTVTAFWIPPDKIMVISVLPEAAWKSSDVQAVLNSLVFSRQERLIMPFIAPGAPLIAEKPSAAPLAPEEIHPCDWGNEVQDSPIGLYMPFTENTQWTAGGWGSYYGDGAHTTANNDYYATDWNKGTYTAPEEDNGQPLYPVTLGKVIGIGNDPNGYGNYVQIQHNKEAATLYGHLSSVDTSIYVGAWVDIAKRIGNVGSTGNSTGAHLHLSYRVGGVSKFNTPPSRRPSPMRTTGGFWQLCDSQSGIVIKPARIESIIADSRYWQFDADNGSQPLPGNGSDLTTVPRYATNGGPCEGKVPGECVIFDTRTIGDLNGRRTESITAYGRYWNFDIDNNYAPWPSNGSDLTSVPRYANGPCQGQTPGNCKFKARTFFMDSNLHRIEYITAYGRYWQFDADNGSQPLPGNGSDLTTVPRYATTGGPCVGKTPGTCKFDTLAVIVVNFHRTESITAYGRYWNFDMDNNYAPWPSNGSDLNSVNRYANGPCQGRAPYTCEFRTRTIFQAKITP